MINMKIINHPAYGYIKCFNTDDLISNTILNNMIWEEDLFNNYIKPNIKPDTTIIDCGAYIGTHSILINKLNRNNDIIVFEMMPEHYKIMVDNIKMNDLHNILPFNNAVSDKHSWITLPDLNYNTLQYNNYGGASIHLPSSNQYIPSIPLDSMEPYFRKPLSFIKMDLEGYELISIRGALNIITKYKPFILIEIWKAQIDFFKASTEFKYLESIGYKLTHIKDDDYYLELCDPPET